MFVRNLTKGFVLKKINTREADQVFTIYTKDFGKLIILSRASRKIKSKLRGGVREFNLSQIEFIQGKNQKTLVDSFIKESFENIPKSLVKLKIGHKISSVLIRLTGKEEKDVKIWNLLRDTFKRLNENESLNSDLKNYYYYFWNFIGIIGFKPSLENCSICSKKISSSPLYFCPEEGGLVCNNCPRENSSEEISAEVVKIIRIIFKNDWNYFVKLKIKKNHFKVIKKISDFYYSFLLESMK